MSNLGKRYYDWNKNFTFSNPERDSEDSKIIYSSNMLTSNEALEYLNISRNTLKKMIENGELNPKVVRDKYNDKKFSYYFDFTEISEVRMGMIFE